MKDNQSYGRLDVSIQNTSYEAGKASPVAIIVRNPFDIPVEILEIQGPRASHLREADLLDSTNHKISDSNKEKINIAGYFKKMLKILSTPVVVDSVSFGGVKASFPRKERMLLIQGQPNSEVTVENSLLQFDEICIQAEEGCKVFLNQPKDNKDLEKESPETFKIEPHCETIAHFQVSTSKWLFFSPMRQPLNTLIKYKVNGLERTQVLSSVFDFKPPLGSSIIGALFGGFLGNLARIFNTNSDFTWQTLLISSGSSLVMSLISAIALARQQFPF